jgi:hypothetical protein
MSNLIQAVDINKLENCGDARQNPKTGNLEFATNYPTLEIFEEIGEKDRAGREASKLNVKAVNKWELWGVKDSCGEAVGGHPRVVNALQFKDNVIGTTDSIQSVDDSCMIVGLTQLVHGVGSEDISLKDGGNQNILELGSGKLKLSYKRNLPLVGEKIKYRENYYTQNKLSEFVEEINYTAQDSEYQYGNVELKKGSHYTIKVTGKITRSDSTIIDGNYVVPQGDTSKKRVSSFGVSNSQNVEIKDDSLTYSNGGEYIKSFTAVDNSTIGFRVADYDRTDSEGSIKIRLYKSVKQPLTNGIITNSVSDHFLNPYNKEGQSVEEYVVKSIDETTNKMTLKRSDRDTNDWSAVETYIISPTLGKWWNSSKSDCLLKIEGISDDSTAFSQTFEIEQGEDKESLDMYVIVANCNGLSICYNGQSFYDITSKLCYSFSTETIKVGDNENSTLVNSSAIVKPRFVRHFEWLFFDQEFQSNNIYTNSENFTPWIKQDDLLYVMSYLRCKYGYPWDNGVEEVGKWKECKQLAIKKVVEPPPPTITCCFTTISWTYMSQTYLRIKETTHTHPVTNYFENSSTSIAVSASVPTITTDNSGETHLTCTDKEDTISEWGVSGQTRSTMVENWYGPFGIPTWTQTIFPIPCVPVVNRKNLRPLENQYANLEGLKSETYETTIGAYGEYTTEKTSYFKPSTYETKIGEYAKIGNTTGRIIGITEGDVNTYQITNLYVKNDVNGLGSETTTGTTTSTNLTYAYISCKPKSFGGTWTYISPVRDVVTHTAIRSTTWTTTQTLKSATKVSSEYPTYAKWFTENGEVFTLVVANTTAKPITFKVYVPTDVTNTFDTTSTDTTSTKSEYYGDYYTTETASTSELAYEGGETIFVTYKNQMPKSTAWTSVNTYSTILIGNFTTSVQAFSFDNMDNLQEQISHYQLCAKTDATTELWNQALVPLTNKSKMLFSGSTTLHGKYQHLDIENNTYAKQILGFDRKGEIRSYGDISLVEQDLDFLTMVAGDGRLIQKPSLLDDQQKKQVIDRRRQEQRRNREFRRRTKRNSNVYRAVSTDEEGRHITHDVLFGHLPRTATSSSSMQSKTYVGSYKHSPDSTLEKISYEKVTYTWSNVQGNSDYRASVNPYYANPKASPNGLRGGVNDYRKNFPHSESSTMPPQNFDTWYPDSIQYDPYNRYQALATPDSWKTIDTFSYKKTFYAENECDTSEVDDE